MTASNTTGSEQFWLDGLPIDGLMHPASDIVSGREQFWLNGLPLGGFYPQDDIPVCWNYTAQYKNSSKLYKASGCGSFPKNIRVPGNVDKSSGKMIDDGMLINPNKYRIV